MTQQLSALINGVPRDLWGMWCQHNHHVTVADPEDRSEYPADVLADPWPCDTCTPEALMEALRQEHADDLAAAWSEWRDSQ